MYDELTKGSLSNARSYGEEPQSVEGQPLSLEIMNRTAYALEVANGICARLYSFKDRVHGATPTPVGVASTAQQQDPGHFAAAWRQRFSSLEEALSTIDRLTNEIANRF